MYETEWQTCYWISEYVTLALFLAHALYSTFENTKDMLPFPKDLEHTKGYEIITNTLPEDFQASVWVEINSEFIFLK